MRQEIEQTRTEMSGTLEAIGDRVSPSRQIERRWNRMRLGGRRAKERVMGSADDMRGWLTEKAHDIGDAPDAAMQGVKSSTQGSPLIAGAVAVGVGALAGALIPVGRREREIMAEPAHALLEPVKEQVSEMRQEVMDDLREPIQHAVAEVKDGAKTAVGEVRDAAQEGAQSVKAQAQQSND
jgi:hypothetical protein